jgi:hypothetical protein
MNMAIMKYTREGFEKLRAEYVQIWEDLRDDRRRPVVSRHQGRFREEFRLKSARRGKEAPMAYELKVEFSDIMSIYSKNHKVGNKNGIKRAYHFAEESMRE